MKILLKDMYKIGNFVGLRKIEFEETGKRDRDIEELELGYSFMLCGGKYVKGKAPTFFVNS